MKLSTFKACIFFIMPVAIFGCDEFCDHATQIVAAASPAEQGNPAFVGRAWVNASSGPERGTVMIFLPDRTLLMDACPGPLHISKWGLAGDHIRWLEDTVPIEAVASMPAANELRLRVVGRGQTQSYIAASPPYDCPGD
jgi:hypothetical protein